MTGCSHCGNTGIHACTGEPAREWTEQEKAGAKEAFSRIADREDAERYRWLRLNPAFETEACLSAMTPAQYDAAVDEAMAIA